MTNDIERRIYKHKAGLIKGFTQKYRVNRLLYFEEFDNITDAREAERVIKGWRRTKKLDLIRTKNPKFDDLANQK